jgi:hypothetical protein
VCAVLLLGLIPVAMTIPALAGLGFVSGVCSLVVAYEAIRYRESRVRVRPLKPWLIPIFVALRGKSLPNSVPKTCPKKDGLSAARPRAV